MSAVLELRDLHKRFGAVQVLRGISLSVAAGERLALVGPNGAGKSTLFDLLSGRQAPSAGQVLLHGRPIQGLPPQAVHRLGLARSFQITQVFGRLTVRENLRCACLAPEGHGLRPIGRLDRLGGVGRRAEALLDRLGLRPRADTPAGELSYAEQRALELGLALAADPAVLLLDEPTAGMSRSEAEAAVALIRELTEGRTLLLVEHDMDVVFNLADRIAVLDQGQLLALDTPQAVRADPRVQRAYLDGAGPC